MNFPSISCLLISSAVGRPCAFCRWSNCGKYGKSRGGKCQCTKKRKTNKTKEETGKKYQRTGKHKKICIRYKRKSRTNISAPKYRTIQKCGKSDGRLRAPCCIHLNNNNNKKATRVRSIFFSKLIFEKAWCDASIMCVLRRV